MKDAKVCPSCLAEPWTHLVGDHDRKQPNFCSDCGDKLIPRSELPRDIWKDPAVREALKERPAFDIACLRCPKCHELGYYNEGSSFTCRFCDETIRVDEELAQEFVLLADTVTDTTDGYNNETK